MDPTTVLLAVATLGGLYMAWTIGANDVANAMATSVGSGALTLRGAIVVAAICEFGGAMLVGGSVSRTLAGGIVDMTRFEGEPSVVAAGMGCCLLGSAAWLNFASYRGWPVSTTHSIVGAIVGFGLVAGGLPAVDWSVLLRIALSWVVSPLLGALLGYGVFALVRRTILHSRAPVAALRRVGPYLVFPVFGTLTLSLLRDGLEPLQLDLDLDVAAPLSLLAGAAASAVFLPLLGRVADRHRDDDELAAVERVFGLLQIVTACYVAFAHGSNDVANSVGPLTAVYGAVGAGLVPDSGIPPNLLLIGAVGMVIGLSTYGYNVMSTVGRGITALTPSRGFSAEFGAATTILVASTLGIPVSTTHTLVGAVLGVGLARSLGAIDMQVMRGIVQSWLFTVPVTATLAAVLYTVARALL